MQPSVLTNKDEFPTEEIIVSYLGKTKVHWESLFGRIQSLHPDFAGQWRYYNDGKSWLFKMQRKAKTIFWLSVFDGGFRTTFYFPARAGKPIVASAISPALKEQFKSGPSFGKIRGITIVYRKKKDVADALQLIGIKLTLR